MIGSSVETKGGLNHLPSLQLAFPEQLNKLTLWTILFIERDVKLVMSTEHFNRLGNLASVILAANDTIIGSGEIVDGAPGARYLSIRRHNIPFHLYAHPSNLEVTLESVYRPSNVYDFNMTDADVEAYADKARINAQNKHQLRSEVINHRVMSLNSEIDVDDAYKTIKDANSLSEPQVRMLPLDEYSDDPDGFVVRESLYPGEDGFSLSKYQKKVNQALDVRIELSRELHRSLGLDDLSDDPTEQDPDEPSSGMENHAFA